MNQLRKFLGKHKRFLILLYLPIYLVWFCLLEKYNTHVTIIHCPLDDMIPFNKYYIIPYLMWFGYVASVVVLLGLRPQRVINFKHDRGIARFFIHQDMNDFYKCCAMLMLGMTISLIVFTVFPNGLDLRPDCFEINDVFSRMVAALYKTDTPTNVFPSIHVLNSLVVNYSFTNSASLRSLNKTAMYIWKFISWLLCILICLATMFLKQHSVIDVCGGTVLFFICWFIVCRVIYKKNDDKD